MKRLMSLTGAVVPLLAVFILLSIQPANAVEEEQKANDRGTGEIEVSSDTRKLDSELEHPESEYRAFEYQVEAVEVSSTVRQPDLAVEQPASGDRVEAIETYPNIKKPDSEFEHQAQAKEEFPGTTAFAPSPQPALELRRESTITDVPSIADIDRPATTVDRWREQLVQAALAKIVGVRLESTGSGTELVLETIDELSLPEISTTGNALIADIPNAVLELADGEEDVFLAEPMAGIALINVTNLPDNRVRVAITGVDAPPAIEVSVGEAGLILGLALGDATAAGMDEEGIELLVTGDRYAPLDASTGTRTNTRILDVPQSIQVIPEEVLEEQAIVRVDSALRNVSGVVGALEPFSSGATLTIRGFDSDNFTNGSILRDGFKVYSNFAVQETTNLERIEVLKGPTSVLYGQNDPGGIINLVTKRPLYEPFHEFKFQAGSFGLLRPSVDLSAPVTQDGRVRYRLNASYHFEDGFRDFETDTSRFFVAPVVTWDISDRTQISFEMEYVNDESPFDIGLPASGDGVVDVPPERNIGELEDILRTRATALGYRLEHQFNEDWSLNHAFRYEGQHQEVDAALTAFFNPDTGIATRIFAIREFTSDDYTVQTNAVGKFSTGPVEHTLLAGFDLNWNHLDDRLTKRDFSTFAPLNVFDPEYGATPRPDFDTVPDATPEFDTVVSRLGFFLQDQIEFSENVILVGSVRYDSVDFRNNGENTSRYDTAWSPRVGLIYQPIETVSLFASYSQSFQPTVSLDEDGNFLEPERSDGYEFGVKAELLEGNLLLNLAYFDITKRNVPTTVDVLTGAAESTGKQRSQGLEFDVVGEILPGWNIIGFYAYTDARVTEDNTIPEGNRLFNAPYSSASLWTTYEIQGGDLQGLGFGVGFNYVGTRFGDLANSFEVDEYFLTNAALFYRRDNWRLGLNFNNLFDVNYIRSVGGLRNFGILPGAPFSVVGTVAVEF